MYNDFHNPPISPLPKHSLYDSYSPRNSSYSTTSISNTTDNGNSNNKVKSKSSNSKMSTIRNFLKKKECMICIEKRYIKSFVIISKNCNHDTNICDECVKKYIENSYEIKSLVKKDLYERYDKLALRKALQQMSDIRWCKNPKCGSAQSHIGSDSEPILTCGDCGTKSCFTHDSLWHEGLTCQQYDEVEKARNEATHTYLEQHTKPCPKCGVRISKNEGCDHMTCKVLECKHEFCWL
ncbi:549_t:CDS:2 [Entrophospora sp. SA101]|nr:549_t:CDS:2 [Entrophospora sp. SA101]